MGPIEQLISGRGSRVCPIAVRYRVGAFGVRPGGSRLFAAFCCKADNFLRVVGLQPSSKEVEQELGNECDAVGELPLDMFHSDVLASRLKRFNSKTIN